MKYSFKKGDKVKRINGENYGMNEGDTGIVTGDIETDNDSKDIHVKLDKNGNDTFHNVSNIVLIAKNKNMNNLKEKFVGLFLTEPEKSFRKAGITDGDGMLTKEGTEVFLAWLLKKNGDVFKTEVVDPLLVEEK